MYYKKLYFVVITCFLFNVDAKSFRRSKRPRPKPVDDSTPQPNVVTYSTYGFNDVGGFDSYDGFVPSSPDYLSHLSNFKQESETRLYAPAFPTALDNYSPQSQNGQFSLDDEVQKNTQQYPQSSMSFTNTPSLDGELQNQHAAHEIYGRNSGDPTAPTYGTKISSRGKGKHLNHFNNSDVNLFSSPSDNKYSFHEVQSTYDSKPSSFAEASQNNFQFAFNYATTHPTSSTDENDDYIESSQTNSQNNLKFPKVYDFTNLKKYYPTELSTSTTKAPNGYKAHSNIQNENTFFKEFEELSTKFPSLSLPYKDQYKEKEEGVEKENKPLHYTATSYGNFGNDYSPNYLNYPNTENSYKDTKQNLDYKDKFKFNSWPSTNYTKDFKSWTNPIKGYQYSTNYSNMNFEFDFSGSKKPSNNSNEEVVPASSNIDFSKYQFPDPDFSTFKKFPGSHKGFDVEDSGDGFESLQPQRYKYDPEEYVKSLYSTTPATSGIWGSAYKNLDFSSFKKYKRPQFGEDIGDDIVHIPKRPHGTKFSFNNKPTEWSFHNSHKPYKSTKPSPYNNWNKEVSTRFKSEEDLLGLRTHDTSHPAYLPTYKQETNSLMADTDYKKLVEKWRQSYLRAKYADTGVHDYEGYSTNMKPIHVPVPKPYAIEVPHPVIVPVPQPYPVRVPVPKPVAVPVVRELTVQVIKPVPYPVVKKVPYPVEKPVPVPVEKEVQVPVIKPYPVPIPHIRPVFHHSRPQEMDTFDEDDDYFPRPEKESSKKVPYSKRVKSSRTRTRRPTRTYERNRRRWPTRRPVERLRRPKSPANRPYERDLDDFDHSYSDYILHCRKTGNC